jgi:hypothetical protein
LNSLTKHSPYTKKKISAREFTCEKQSQENKKEGGESHPSFFAFISPPLRDRGHEANFDFSNIHQIFAFKFGENDYCNPFPKVL